MKRNRRQSGQALVAATFGLVALLGAAGLAVDMGYLRYQRRLQQSAADSAALAGAAESASGNATAAAREDSSLNGFTDGVNHVTITVNPAFPFGPTTGVQVQVSAVQPTFFMRIFGVNSSTVSAAAVAINSSAKNCVYALTGGTGINNSGAVDAAGCGIVDDQSLFNTGRITAASVAVHGTAAGAGTIPAAITGIIAAGDPLYRLTPPGGGGGGCTTSTLKGTNGAAPPTNFTLSAGKYCSITVTQNANLTLNPGTYTFTTGSLTLNGNGNVTGNDVTFYFRAGAGSAVINSVPGSKETLSLVAPTTGALAGILFYQNTGNNSTATIDGQGTSKLQGALYFPDATLNLSNTGTTAAYTIVVAKSLSFAGTVNLTSNYSSLAGGSPIKSAVLVE